MHSSDTKQFGLIGFPLKHSFSQRYFTEKFASENIRAEYLNFEIAQVAELPQILTTHPQLCGLNVTIPHKQSVLSFLDDLHPQAQQVGAVNVIKVIRQGTSFRLIGYNSDLVGFQQSIAPLLQSHHRKALILGTGGASKAVKCGLQNLGVESTYVSRSPQVGQLDYTQLSAEVMQDYGVIVNCTPLGTFPNVDECPPIPYHLLTDKHLLYDLVYNPAETLFLRLGKEKGAIVKNGAEMLTLQAEEAWRIWNE